MYALIWSYVLHELDGCIHIPSTWQLVAFCKLMNRDQENIIGNDILVIFMLGEPLDASRAPPKKSRTVPPMRGRAVNACLQDSALAHLPIVGKSRHA